MSIVATPIERVYDALYDKVASGQAEGVAEAQTSAIRCVQEMLRTGAFGEGPYNITVSGHVKQGKTDPVGNNLSVSIYSLS